MVLVFGLDTGSILRCPRENILAFGYLLLDMSVFMQICRAFVDQERLRSLASTLHMKAASVLRGSRLNAWAFRRFGELRY